MPKAWKNFFDTIAPVYENEIFTRNTVAEVDFLLEELQLLPGARILDIGCGTGRHAIELARRDFIVTGVDISPGMLAVARKNAVRAAVDVEFVECPAQDYVAGKKFDAVISLCEGALCLFADEDNIWSKDMAIFANMANMLEPGRPFLVTVLNAFRLIRSITDAEAVAGGVDLFTLTTRNVNSVDVDGQQVVVEGIERYYTPPELVRMVSRVGLKIDKIYGGTAGSWHRGPVLLDEIEFMAIGHRK